MNQSTQWSAPATGSPGAQRYRRRIGASRAVRPWMYLLPAILLFTYFKFIPIVRAITFSFQEVSILGDDVWIGFANYRDVLHNPDFRDAVVRTLVYTAMVVGMAGVVGFFTALLLQGQSAGIRVVRGFYFVPVVVAVAVVAEIWIAFLWPTSFGIVNRIIGTFGLGPYRYFSSPDTALGSVIAMHIWKLAPYNAVIFVAGLAAVNRDLYDVADVDGANRFQKTWYVTIPSISGAIYIVLLLSIIRVLRTFQEVYITTGGGPAKSTQIAMTHIYRYGFEIFDFGYASAASVLLFAFTLAATLLVQRFRGRES